MKQIIIEVPDDFGATQEREKTNTEIIGELVRCKDCEYYDDEPTYKDGYCDKFEMCVRSDWYCADGERNKNVYGKN